jgi:hypothetical protein
LLGGMLINFINFLLQIKRFWIVLLAGQTLLDIGTTEQFLYLGLIILMLAVEVYVIEVCIVHVFSDLRGKDRNGLLSRMKYLRRSLQ